MYEIHIIYIWYPISSKYELQSVIKMYVALLIFSKEKAMKKLVSIFQALSIKIKK